MLRFTNDSPNIMLLTDEDYGCNYVGVRVLVSRGNVFFFFLLVINSAGPDSAADTIPSTFPHSDAQHTPL